MDAHEAIVPSASGLGECRRVALAKRGYLGNYARALAALASRAPRSPWILPLSQCAFCTAMLEQDFRERAHREFRLNGEEIAGTPRVGSGNSGRCWGW